ncbi:MAG: hypothetical protein QG567_1495 [Campylobacterota bacterium]|nr:hypothetical protein [Campylobacterota bacterium]MDQ1340338.1 hypothetical protein [Campylobacterota bacterium]
MSSISHVIEEINKIDEKFKKLIALNQRQAADTIGVSSSTMESWRREGLGPSYIKMNNGKRGRVLYPKTAIAEWLVNRSVITA